MSTHGPLLAPDDEVDVAELLPEEQLLKVVDEGALGEGRELDAVQLPAPAGLGVHGPPEDIHGIVADRGGVEHAGAGDLAPRSRLDDAPGPRVHIKGMDLVVEDAVGRAPKDVQAASEAHHGVAVPALGRGGGTPQKVLRPDPEPLPLVEIELVQVVGDLGPALPRKHVHAVVHNHHGEVATSWGVVPSLLDLLPLGLARLEVDGPHVVEAGVAVVAGEYPHLVLVHDGAVPGPRRRQGSRHPVFPAHPLRRGELVLVEVVLVAQVRVRVDVSRVAAEDEHAAFVHNGGVVVSWGRRSASVYHAGPRGVAYVAHQKVVQHLPTVVPSEKIHAVAERHHGVLTTGGSDELLTALELLPIVDGLVWAEV